MLQAPEQPDWVSALSGLASAANFGLLIFAGVQVWREKKRDEQRVAAAIAQASNRGYLLRRRLRALIGATPSQDSFETQLRTLQRLERYHEAVDSISAEAQALSTIAADASPAIAAAAQVVYVHVHEGLRRLEDYIITDRPRQIDDELAWLDLQSAALSDFVESIAQLERRVISPALLNTEDILTRVRSELTFEGTIAQIADQIVRRDEDESSALQPSITRPSTQLAPLPKRPSLIKRMLQRLRQRDRQ